MSGAMKKSLTLHLAANSCVVLRKLLALSVHQFLFWTLTNKGDCEFAPSSQGVVWGMVGQMSGLDHPNLKHLFVPCGT